MAPGKQPVGHATPSPKKKKATTHASGSKSVQPSEKLTDDPTQVLLERRLFSARKTKRLDLSVPLHPCGYVPGHLPLLQVFPRQVFMYEHLSGHHLRELWLTNHLLSILPPEIAQFSQLRVLGLAGNTLTSLPHEIKTMASLESLYLERNHIHSLGDSFQFPFQLRDLRLDHNAFTSFPLQVTALRLLNRLGLSHNQLAAIPVEVRRLTNLVELDLDHNGITTDGLPTEALGRLQKLERLGLDGNRLRERPACLSVMPNLVYVRLNGNREGGEGAPRRHDGFWQCVQGYQPHKPPSGDETVDESTSRRPPEPLQAVLACRDCNLINAQSYDTHVSLA